MFKPQTHERLHTTRKPWGKHINWTLALSLSQYNDAPIGGYGQPKCGTRWSFGKTSSHENQIKIVKSPKFPNKEFVYLCLSLCLPIHVRYSNWKWNADTIPPWELKSHLILSTSSCWKFVPQQVLTDEVSGCTRLLTIIDCYLKYRLLVT